VLLIANRFKNHIASVLRAARWMLPVAAFGLFYRRASRARLGAGRLAEEMARSASELRKSEAQLRHAQGIAEDRLIHLPATRDVNVRGEVDGLDGTCQDITDRVLRDQAERANHAKNEFISRMSHELRTPLNAILGFAQLMLLEETSARKRECTHQIISAGRHLLDLITELLDLSRIEAGQLRLSPEPVCVSELAQQTVDLVAPSARARAIRIGVESSDEVWAKADVQRLRQVLLNLLSNAVKYNRDGGTVTVRIGQVNESARIVVADDGPGIATSLVERLFVPFERLGAENSDVEGTGLGLALCERMVEVMGGTIDVETSAGQGAAFIVELKATNRPDPPVVSRTGGGPGDLAALRGVRRVLCIEDNRSNLALIKQLFSARSNAEILTAERGEEGLLLARSGMPDLILLDLGLPDMPGEQVLARLKADPDTALAPVVILTADATPRQQQRMLSLGAQAYLTKPIDLNQLIEVIRSISRREVRAA
jgi:signal transduction histidine kinase/ActR/RegA family two-component response regulator